MCSDAALCWMYSASMRVSTIQHCSACQGSARFCAWLPALICSTRRDSHPHGISKLRSTLHDASTLHAESQPRKLAEVLSQSYDEALLSGNGLSVNPNSQEDLSKNAISLPQTFNRDWRAARSAGGNTVRTDEAQASETSTGNPFFSQPEPGPPSLDP